MSKNISTAFQKKKIAVTIPISCWIIIKSIKKIAYIHTDKIIDNILYYNIDNTIDNIIKKYR